MAQIETYYCISEAGGQPVRVEAASHLIAAIMYRTLHNYSDLLDTLRTELTRSIPGNLAQPAESMPGVKVYKADCLAAIGWEEGQLFRIIVTEDMAPAEGQASASITIKRVER